MFDILIRSSLEKVVFLILLSILLVFFNKDFYKCSAQTQCPFKAVYFSLPLSRERWERYSFNYFFLFLLSIFSLIK